MIKIGHLSVARIFCSLFLFFLLLSSRSISEAADYGDIIITPESIPQEVICHGYIECRIKIRNLSSAKSHNVRVMFPSRNRYGEIESISREVLIPAGTMSEVSMFQPAMRQYGRGLRVFIDGKEKDPISNFKTPDIYHDTIPHVLISRSLNRDTLNRRLQETKIFKKDSYRLTRTELPPSQWSDKWLSYSCFDGVFISDDDIEDMSPGTINALQDYVSTGGSLTVLGDYSIENFWEKDKKNISEGMISYYSGFGEYLVVYSLDIESLTDNQLITIAKIWRSTLKPWKKKRFNANVDFPIKEIHAIVNLKGQIMLMLLFIILVGPVNFIILARLKKKIWLVWTAPMISLIFCVSIMIYAVFSEGFDSYARISYTTFLDENTHRASTIGRAGYYSPLTPGKGLWFDYETEITPIYSRHEEGTSKTIDWTSGQHLKTGWLSARIPGHFKIRKCQLRRERISLSTDQEGNHFVVNGLGAPIEKLYLADHSGRLYRAEEIKAGARVRLPITKDIIPSGKLKKDWLRSQYRNPAWQNHVDTFSYNPNSKLKPGSYIAILNGSPFVEMGLEDAENQDLTSVVYGILARGSGF